MYLYIKNTNILTYQVGILVHVVFVLANVKQWASKVGIDVGTPLHLKYRNNYFFRKFVEEFHFPKTLVRRDHRLLQEYQDLSFLRDP
jgi:hypothetical protein